MSPKNLNVLSKTHKLLLDKLVKEDKNLNLQAARITKRVKKDYLNFFNQQFINLINEMN